MEMKYFLLATLALLAGNPCAAIARPLVETISPCTYLDKNKLATIAEFCAPFSETRSLIYDCDGNPCLTESAANSTKDHCVHRHDFNPNVDPVGLTLLGPPDDIAKSNNLEELKKRGPKNGDEIIAALKADVGGRFLRQSDIQKNFFPQKKSFVPAGVLVKDAKKFLDLIGKQNLKHRESDKYQEPFDYLVFANFSESKNRRVDPRKTKNFYSVQEDTFKSADDLKIPECD